jgi:hypothetical protein
MAKVRLEAKRKMKINFPLCCQLAPTKGPAKKANMQQTTTTAAAAEGGGDPPKESGGGGEDVTAAPAE